MLAYAWVVLIWCGVISILQLLGGTPGGAAFGLTGLAQVIFAVLYIKGLASGGWAIMAVVFSAVQLLMVLGTGVPLAEGLGHVLGSLAWGAFPILYLWKKHSSPAP